MKIVSDVLFTVDFAVIEDCRVNEFPQLKGIHLLDQYFLELSRGADAECVIDLWYSLDQVLDLHVNEILPLGNPHKTVDTAMVTFHELNIVVFVFGQVRLELPRNPLLRHHV